MEGQICVSELATMGCANEPTVRIRGGYGEDTVRLPGAPQPARGQCQIKWLRLPAGECVSAKAGKLAAFSGSADEFDPGMVEGKEFEDEAGLVPVAVGLEGEGLGSGVG